MESQTQINTSAQPSQQQQYPASELLNGRYKKVKRLGEGSYGTVFLAIDTKPQGIKRKIDPKYLQLLEKVADKPKNDYEEYNQQQDKDGDTQMKDEEQKQALQVLENKQVLFNQNEAFEGVQIQAQDGNQEQLVAIKKFKLNSFNERNGIPFTALREIKILQELNHPNIIGLYDVFYIQKTIFLALEYMPHEFTNLIRDQTIVLKEEHIKNIMFQILCAMDYLHQNFIMHRDLTPGNLLITNEGTLKLADFGLAKIYGTPERQHSAGVVTREYRAPEVLFDSKFYGPMIDMWSVGCILGELMIRLPLFPGRTDIDQLGKIFTLRGSPNNSNWPGVEDLPNYLEFTIKEVKPLREVFPFANEQCLDLLDKLLQLNPCNRPTASEALQHPYFTSEAPQMCKNSELPLPTKSKKQ
eukprot:403363111